MNVLTVLVLASVLLKVLNPLPVILIIIFFLPVIFQLFAGLKALRGKIKVKFWIVSLVSIVVQILATSSLLLLMAHNLKQSGINEGLGFLFVELLGVLMIAIILIVIGFQLIINRKKIKD